MEKRNRAAMPLRFANDHHGRLRQPPLLQIQRCRSLQSLSRPTAYLLMEAFFACLNHGVPPRNLPNLRNRC